MAVALRRLDQALDLELGQVLPIAAHLPVAGRSETVRNSESGVISRRFDLAMIFAPA
jgi:hypothetical protein